MPHATRHRPLSDDRTDPPAAGAEAPAVLTRPRCPSCGREPAVVFPLLAPATGPGPNVGSLVCLACCPTEPPAG
jgi:hypothetical protein